MFFKINEIGIDKLAAILKKHDLNEIEYKKGSVTIRIASHPTITKINDVDNIQNNTQQNLAQPNKDSLTKLNKYESHKGAVKSPMVGTCYMAPDPESKNFVSLGDAVQEGQPLLIIEAMKVMNLIKSPCSGKVTHIAVSNAEPVEYNQLLMIIE
jgi:acetyl-CoA carboxylase biotin carboxyl carrier protein